MAQRKTLTEDQLAILRWIDEGCPDSVVEGYSHRISVVALARRGLVVTSGHGAAWSASVTAAGHDYLERAESPVAPAPRQANTSVTQQLVDDVVAAGGSLRLPQKRYLDRSSVDYRNRAQLAERYGKVPVGKRLVVETVSADEIEVRLIEAPEGTSIETDPVPVPRKISRYHPVVRRFREDSERHEISRAATGLH